MTKKPRKQTSDRVSSIAARYLGMSENELRMAMLTDQFMEDFRSLAASALSQDETPK